MSNYLCYIAPYVVPHAITYIGTNVGMGIGSKVGWGIVDVVWVYITDKLYGSLTLTCKNTKTYIVHNGIVTEVSENKKYTVAGGKLLVEDIDLADSEEWVQV